MQVFYFFRDILRKPAHKYANKSHIFRFSNYLQSNFENTVFTGSCEYCPKIILPEIVAYEIYYIGIGNIKEIGF